MNRSSLVRIFYAAAVLLVGSGCTNEPGALNLTIIPERPEFATDEPILIRAVLSAKGEPVCLSQSYRYSATVTPVELADAATHGDSRVYRCGLQRLVVLFTWPVLLPASLLDVTDVGRRFDIIDHSQERWKTLALTSLERQGQRYVRSRRIRCGQNIAKIESQWPPGEYCIRLQLINRHTGPYPPPLFWKPYDRPVEAETTVRIVERDEPADASPAS